MNKIIISTALAAALPRIQALAAKVPADWTLHNIDAGEVTAGGGPDAQQVKLMEWELQNDKGQVLLNTLGTDCVTVESEIGEDYALHWNEETRELLQLMVLMRTHVFEFIQLAKLHYNAEG